MIGKITVAWCGTPSRAAELAAFFACNVGTDYISHAELQGGRALSPTEWRSNLTGILRAEIDARLATAPSGPAGQPIAVAEEGGTLLALAFVTFAGTAPAPFAIVEDLIVAPQTRGRGVGKTMLDWIAAEARARGIRRLFLESGFKNERAHDFFEREGFRPTSVVMMRELE
jgi:GNAT superfamily N-acetyltransferase